MIKITDVERDYRELTKQINAMKKLYSEVSTMTDLDKINARKKAKYGDWIIHAVYDDKNPNEPIDYHTHGLEKYGLLNICMSKAGVKYAKACTRILNEIAWSMIKGDVFAPGMRHYVDNNKDELYHVFDVECIFKDEDDERMLKINYLFNYTYKLPTNGKYYVFSIKHDKYGEWIRVN